MGGEAGRIYGCLEELEKDKAAAVLGACIKGESYTELAERYGEPLSAMRIWLRCNPLKFKECLER